MKLLIVATVTLLVTASSSVGAAEEGVKEEICRFFHEPAAGWVVTMNYKVTYEFSWYEDTGDAGIVADKERGNFGYFSARGLDDAGRFMYAVTGMADTACLLNVGVAVRGPVTPASWVLMVEQVVAGEMTWEQAVATAWPSVPG